MPTKINDIRANAWTGSQTWPSQNEYYIHNHIVNIGRANGGMALNENDLSQAFAAFKNKALSAVKKQYRTLFQRSLVKNQMSQETITMLDSIMDKDKNMSSISHQIGRALSQALSEDKMATLMQYKINAIAKMNKARDILKTFDEILDIYIKTCELLMKKDLRDYLITGLLALKQANKNAVSAGQLGKNLLAALQQAEHNININKTLYTKVEIQQIRLVMGEMEQLGVALSSHIQPNFNPFHPKDGIQKMFLRVFENGFSEAVSGEIYSTAKLQINNAIDVHFSGKDGFKILYFDDKGENPQVKTSTRALAGKADVIFKNVKVQLRGRNGKTKDIVINIGISDKFYSSINFSGVIRGKKNTRMSGGGAGKLVDMIISTLGKNKRLLYLSYNTLAFGSSLPAAAQSLQDVVTTRAIVNMFSSRGGSGDFAQFIFVNNQVVSIWDIIMGSSTFLGKTSSLNPVSQLVILSTATPNKQGINYRKQAQNEANKIPTTELEKIKRIQTINKYINSINISVQLDLEVLRNLATTKIF